MEKVALYKQLVDRYLDGSASAQEVEVFFHLLNAGELDALLDPEAVISAPGETAPVRRIAAWKKYSVAAAVILLLGAGAWMLFMPRHTLPVNVATNLFKNDIAPGGNKAILTLGDGTTILLDSAGKGALASQGGTAIVKTDSGKLTYNAGAAGANTGATGANTGAAGASVLSNTLSTPAGGQYQVTLADGTKVWLNAQSSLQYPSAFTGRDRTVQLTGEAYFEVAKDKSRPFFVKLNGIAVQVLGTSFNVNGYTDEPDTRTTLLDGAVQLVKGEMTVPLTPGQQGVTTGLATGGISVHNADTDEVMAWKNGFFSWDAADVHTVMRQISRWYGVQVRYQGNPTPALFGGQIGRDLSLTQVLTGLSKSKVHFQLEGKVLTVLP